MFAIPRGRLVAAALGLTAAAASAQGPFTYGPVAGCAVGHCAAANHGTYGPALFAANPNSKHFVLAGPNEPGCVGRSSYPLSDWHYIRQFCGPTLQPGTCYGYHQTKWRKWEDHCPGDATTPCPTAIPLMVAPPGLTVPPGPLVPVVPSDPLPPPKENKPAGDQPKIDPVTPPKVPLIPKGAGTTPTPLPAIPAVPKTMPTPTEPGKISTTESLMPMPPSALVPPSPEPRVVVSPTGK